MIFYGDSNVQIMPKVHSLDGTKKQHTHTHADGISLYKIKIEFVQYSMDPLGYLTTPVGFLFHSLYLSRTKTMLLPSNFNNKKNRN